MILVDANLLLYAVLPVYPQHVAAHEWLDGRLGGAAQIGLPWESLLAFVRISSDRRLFERPVPLREAWAVVEAWLHRSTTWIPVPGPRHQAVLDELMDDALPSRLVPDAHLAALALEYGLIVASADRDFATFPGVRWENPIAG